MKFFLSISSLFPVSRYHRELSMFQIIYVNLFCDSFCVGFVDALFGSGIDFLNSYF